MNGTLENIKLESISLVSEEQVLHPSWRIVEVKKQHHYRVEVLYDGFLHRVVEYDGTDYDAACKEIGGLCLYAITADKLFLYRDGEQVRYVELRA